MNLPEHRRAQAGRTWPSTYRAESFAALERTKPSVIADVVIAVVIGVIGAALAVHWLAS